jgi:hypothetical protein
LQLAWHKPGLTNIFVLSFFSTYFCSLNGSRFCGIKREPGVNPGHYPMLLAPLKAFLLPVLPLPIIGREGRKKVE